MREGEGETSPKLEDLPHPQCPTTSTVFLEATAEKVRRASKVGEILLHFVAAISKS